MKIPQDWLSEYYRRLEGNIMIRPSLKRIEKEVEAYINHPFNANWELPSHQEEDFKEFFISTLLNQTNPLTHGLTCGVDSQHYLLVPRMDYRNKCYLICPTCGHIQYSVL
jgi:hypothetical protein